MNQSIESKYETLSAGLNNMVMNPNFKAEVEKLAKLFAYVGYDVKEFLTTFEKYCPQREDEKAKDIIELITILCSKGSAISKFAAGNANYKRLRDTYRVKDNTKESSHSTVITLPRIAAAFPLITLRVMHHGKFERRCPVTTGVPNAICCSQIMPLLGAIFRCENDIVIDTMTFEIAFKKDTIKNLLRVIIDYLVREAKILNKAMKSLNHQEIYEKSLAYWKPAIKSDEEIGLNPLNVMTSLHEVGALVKADNKLIINNAITEAQVQFECANMLNDLDLKFEE